MIRLPDDDADLLDECDVTTFRAGGPGGQHQNTTDSAVRLRHRPTGIVVVCRSQRSQHQNRATCLRRLRERADRLNAEETRTPRTPTGVPRGERERRLADKAHRAAAKRRRGRPDSDGE